jgi:beta-lactam-binding protein with PASTA domain
MTDVRLVSPATSHTGPVRKVRVPELVGAPAADAHDRALDAGVLAVAENATHTGAGRGRIDRQDPDPGAEVEHGAIVRIWIGS